MILDQVNGDCQSNLKQLIAFVEQRAVQEAEFIKQLREFDKELSSDGAIRCRIIYSDRLFLEHVSRV